MTGKAMTEDEDSKAKNHGGLTPVTPRTFCYPKFRLLDLFCCQGGAGTGYARAGFEVTGVDIEPQPLYPFTVIQADALAYAEAHWREYDAIHASPPCQAYSILTPTDYKGNHPALIAPVRELLQKIGLPYVIENVPGARQELESPVMLCGTMFGLNVQRHRYFEMPWLTGYLLPPCNHSTPPVVVSGTSKRLVNGKRRENLVSECRESMETPWMTRSGLDEAIPPAYTEWIGRQLMNHLKDNDKAHPQGLAGMRINVERK